ncbi:hypothetical protein RIVM261_081370 [Rivularia sp. IAM M-261]|nr:hypothetical protein CAL7716_015690 [Calothrix sp. PCC 7716]GJD23181.1 hypothetical protein RIVM261_081370 [Rivularia sp. IAM M-261]
MDVANKDAKRQLMQAFEQIIAERKPIESKIATKLEVAEKAKNKQILEAASTYTVDSIVKSLADLQLEFGAIVNSLSEKLAKENSKLDELNRGIEIETTLLQEIQQVRVVADAVDILTQEHQEKLKTLEQDTLQKREELSKEAAQARKDWLKEQAEFDEAVQVYNQLLFKQRQQETEDYQYKLENTRKINTDAYEAKKRNLERELKEGAITREKNWAEREITLKANQTLLGEYQNIVTAFPAELEEAVKKAREEAIKDTSQKAKVEADLLEKEWEGAKQSYELKVKSLEETIQKQVEQIESISTQLQTTLKQAQDLAMRAFSSN